MSVAPTTSRRRACRSTWTRVGSTARQGYERGYKVVVLEDLCATDDQELHDAELAVLRKGFARVATSDELAAELGRTVAAELGD